MTAEDLIAEARGMALPCLYLTTSSQDGSLVGVWTGQVFGNREPARPWLTVDCGKLPLQFAPFQLTGALSIFLDTEQGGTCVHDKRATSLATGRGTALYGRPASNLPSLPQFLRNPTPAIRQWLAEVGCDTSRWSFRDRARYQPVAAAYSKVYFDEDPTREPDNGIYAILGGWPIEVYEDSWATDVNDPKALQVAFTYEDAEPWVRVWIDGTGEFHVQQIIT
jgi:hypothetical protein